MKLPRDLDAAQLIPHEPAAGAPVQQWTELKEVVEALCSRWPDCEYTSEGKFLL
jgi:hypothetical protein